MSRDVSGGFEIASRARLAQFGGPGICLQNGRHQDCLSIMLAFWWISRESSGGQSRVGCGSAAWRSICSGCDIGLALDGRMEGYELVVPFCGTASCLKRAHGGEWFGIGLVEWQRTGSTVRDFERRKMNRAISSRVPSILGREGTLDRSVFGFSVICNSGSHVWSEFPYSTSSVPEIVARPEGKSIHLCGRSVDVLPSVSRQK
jgi:hypothetical protein